MNDFQMNSLASERRRNLTAEADRHRLASQPKAPVAATEKSEHRSSLRVRLDLILGRNPA